MGIFIQFKEKFVPNIINSNAYIVKMLIDEGDEKVIEVKSQDCAVLEGR